MKKDNSANQSQTGNSKEGVGEGPDCLNRALAVSGITAEQPEDDLRRHCLIIGRRPSSSAFLKLLLDPNAGNILPDQRAERLVDCLKANLEVTKRSVSGRLTQEDDYGNDAPTE